MVEYVDNMMATREGLFNKTSTDILLETAMSGSIKHIIEKYDDKVVAAIDATMNDSDSISEITDTIKCAITDRARVIIQEGGERIDGIIQSNIDSILLKLVNGDFSNLIHYALRDNLSTMIKYAVEKMNTVNNS